MWDPFLKRQLLTDFNQILELHILLVIKESQGTPYSIVPTMNSMKSKVMIYLSLNIFCVLQMEKKNL